MSKDCVKFYDTMINMIALIKTLVHSHVVGAITGKNPYDIWIKRIEIEDDGVSVGYFYPTNLNEEHIYFVPKQMLDESLSDIRDYFSPQTLVNTKTNIFENALVSSDSETKRVWKEKKNQCEEKG